MQPCDLLSSAVRGLPVLTCPLPGPDLSTTPRGRSSNRLLSVQALRLVCVSCAERDDLLAVLLIKCSAGRAFPAAADTFGVAAKRARPCLASLHFYNTCLNRGAVKIFTGSRCVLGVMRAHLTGSMS